MFDVKSVVFNVLWVFVVDLKKKYSKLSSFSENISVKMYQSASFNEQCLKAQTHCFAESASNAQDRGANRVRGQHHDRAQRQKRLTTLHGEFN